MIVNSNYVLIAMIGNQQQMFQYETADVWDALDEFWHEDWPEAVAGSQDDGEFPIDVYAMENGKAIRKYQFQFNFCVFHHFFDKGYLRTDDGGSKTYTLDEFAKHIERKEPNDGDSRIEHYIIERVHEIKVYFPVNTKDGFNETLWVLVDDGVKNLYDNDAEGMVCSGTLDNDSFCNPDLRHGTEVRFKMRGELIPEAIYA